MIEGGVWKLGFNEFRANRSIAFLCNTKEEPECLEKEEFH